MQKVTFSNFQLDLETYSLTKNGEALPIGRRCLDLLLFLIQNRERYVNTETLRREVWREAKLSPAAIPTCVRELRNLLGDRAYTPNIISSKKGRGYRFIAQPEFLRASWPSTKELMTEMPFVGRGHELTAMRAAIRATQGRQVSRTLIIRGEAGIGKSRLLHEFLKKKDHKTNQIVSRCHADRATEFMLWKDTLTQAASLIPNQAKKIQESGLLQFTSDLPRLGEGAPNRRLSERRQLFNRWTTSIRGLVEESPLVLAFEDIHLADPDSLHLIAWISEALHNQPLLLVATQRPRPSSNAINNGIQDIVSLENCETIEVAPLSIDQTYEILRPDLLHDYDSAKALQRATGGNPLLLSHALTNTEKPESYPNPHLAKTQLIARNADLVSRLVSDLPPETREILIASSLAGRIFSPELVASISDLTSLETCSLLEPATQARLLFEERGQYGFCHSITRDAVASIIEPTKSKILHAKIATHLRGRSDSSSSTRVIAKHLALSTPITPYREAALHCTFAFQEARTQLAHAEACRFAEWAVELAKQDNDTQTADRCRLLINLARAKETVGDRASARATLLDVVRTCRAAGLAEIIAECALAMSQDFISIDVGVHDIVVEQLLREALAQTPQEKTALRAQLLARLSLSIRWSESYEEQEALARSSLELAEESGDNASKREALSALTEALHGPEDAPRRLQAISALERTTPQEFESESTLLQHTRMITALLEMGQLDRITSLNSAYHAIANRTGQPHHVWYAITTDSMRSLLAGNMFLPVELESHFHRISKTGENPNVIQGYAVQRFFREVECENAKEVLPLLKEVTARFPLVTSWRSALAWLYWDMGWYDDSIRELSHFTCSRIDSMRRQVGSGAGLGMISEVAAYIGAPRVRHRLFQILEPLSDRCATAGYGVLYLGSFARHAGILARSIGHRRQAIDLLLRSVDQESARGADLWRGYSLVDLAVTVGMTKKGISEAESILVDADRISRATRVPRLARRIQDARTQISRWAQV